MPETAPHANAKFSLIRWEFVLVKNAWKTYGGS
jgi:hypothetical protein